MKRLYIFMFALMLCVTGLAMAHIVPEKPIPVKKMYAFAEEVDVFEGDVIEYEGEDSLDNIFISVIGNAKKSFSPDSAVVNAVIETLDSDMVKSKDDNFDKFQSTISRLKDLEIAEDNITLGYFSTYPSYDYSSCGTLMGYHTTLNFSFKVDNLDNLKEVINAITESGVTCIQDIRYQISNLDEEYEEVLKEAVENAKTKAAKLLNKEDLRVVRIKEENIYYCSDLYRNYAEELENNLLGKIEIKARVNVVFE